MNKSIKAAGILLREHAFSLIAGSVCLAGLILFITGPGDDLLRQAAPAPQPGAPQAAPDGTLIEVGAVERQAVPFTIIPERPRSTVTSHTVQPGETLFSIAGLYGLAPNSIFWANSELLRGDVHMLQTEMELAILPVDGVYHRSDETLTVAEIAARYQVQPEAILTSEYNDLAEYTAADTPPWGMRLVIPGGVSEFADYRPVITEAVDPQTGQVVSGFMQGMGGSCSAGIQGGGGSGAFSLPVGSPVLAQSFFPGHSGLDFAASIGTPALAADTGVVVFAGWVDSSWGYGVLVVLNHGGGFTSYYAHLSSVSVGCGQTVSRGSSVGGIGSTGNSSGPHLHFEIRVNDVPQNPAGYIGY